MNRYMISRIKEEASYMLETNLTIREIATYFKVSKSTVHKDLKERLVELDHNLFLKVKEVLDYHTNVRHIRGGLATKKKYIKMNEKKE